MKKLISYERDSWFPVKRKNPEIKGYKLIVDYPGNQRPIGSFEPYTSGEFSKYPHIWEPILWEDVAREKKLSDLGI